MQHGDDADGDVAQVDTRFNILGYSLGGAIATAYSALHSNDVRRLILVSPAGLMDAIPLLGRVGMRSDNEALRCCDDMYNS